MLEEARTLPVARDSAEVRDRLNEWTEFHAAIIEGLETLLKRLTTRTTTRRRTAVA
jgi:hypothetical protein